MEGSPRSAHAEQHAGHRLLHALQIAGRSFCEQRRDALQAGFLTVSAGQIRSAAVSCSAVSNSFAAVSTFAVVSTVEG